MSSETLQEMESVLKLQKKLHIEEGPASIELRKDRLNRCIKMIKEYSDEIIDALQKDFGNRDPKSSFLTEIAYWSFTCLLYTSPSPRDFG